MEVCLEETFVEALLKFVNLLPLRGLTPDGASANLDTHAEQVLHAMLQSAENNTNVGINSNATSSHRWCGPQFDDVHPLCCICVLCCSMCTSKQTQQCRFFEKLTVDSITIHLTFLPSHERHKRGNSTLLHVAVATGLSMSDLDDIRISLAGFHLSNKLTDPEHLLEMVSGHFMRQVSSTQ